MKVFRRTGRCAAVLMAAATLAMPSVARAADSSPPATTSPKVASEAPVPGGQVATGPAPHVGPFIGRADASSVSPVWWLIAFGGVQIAGLLVVTRRARARLSTSDGPP